MLSDDQVTSSPCTGNQILEDGTLINLYWYWWFGSEDQWHLYFQLVVILRPKCR